MSFIGPQMYLARLNLNLNLPGTPHTSERVLRGVRVGMARKKNMRENKMGDK